MDGAILQAAVVQAVAVPWTAVAAVLLALFINAGAVFYWGGKTAQMLKDHDRRILDHDQRILSLENPK